ncbi:MAG: MucR family transcriptional regulator [Rhizobiaceae bacterium]|nr:MucR family transcriptional regulator [Rhizobiaceae bacterium]
MQNEEQSKLSALTADIVAAYVSNNPLPAANLPELIATVYAAVAGVERPAEPTVGALKPAVNPKRSVFPDYIVCLEDGKRFKSLRRHLSADFGMTPDEYRSKWGLPADYPMVAPNYAATRSELAKKMGLGRKPGAKIKRTAKSRAR